jgi:thiamine biosynthesis lipoprotein
MKRYGQSGATTRTSVRTVEPPPSRHQERRTPDHGSPAGGGGLCRVEELMGTAINLELADPLPEAELERLADEVFEWLHEVDQRFSTYKPYSEVNRLDRGELTVADYSPELREVLQTCGDLWRTTDGYFDVYATGRFDPSGYVKGWAVQVASDRLTAEGALNHYLDAGGDACARGCSPSGAPWQVGIRHPGTTDKVHWMLACADLAIATSSTHERGCHVINPRREAPARGLCSVTVVGPDLGVADAYATAALAMELDGPTWLAGLDGYSTLVITDDGRCLRSDDLPDAAWPQTPSVPSPVIEPLRSFDIGPASTDPRPSAGSRGAPA